MFENEPYEGPLTRMDNVVLTATYRRLSARLTISDGARRRRRLHPSLETANRPKTRLVRHSGSNMGRVLDSPQDGSFGEEEPISLLRKARRLLGRQGRRELRWMLAPQRRDKRSTFSLVQRQIPRQALLRHRQRAKPQKHGLKPAAGRVHIRHEPHLSHVPGSWDSTPPSSSV